VLFIQEKDRLFNKFKSIQSFKGNIVNKMENFHNIRYYVAIHPHNGSKDHKFSFNKHNLLLNDISYDIELKQSDYNFITDNLLEPKEKWFINTSNTYPKRGSRFNIIRRRFCLPPTDNTDFTIQCIKHIENNFSRFQGDNSINKFKTRSSPL